MVLVLCACMRFDDISVYFNVGGTFVPIYISLLLQALHGNVFFSSRVLDLFALTMTLNTFICLHLSSFPLMSLLVTPIVSVAIFTYSRTYLLGILPLVFNASCNDYGALRNYQNRAYMINGAGNGSVTLRAIFKLLGSNCYDTC